MKKLFTLVASLLLAASSYAVTTFTGFEYGKSQTFGQYGGDFKDTENQDFDASKYDYVWLKYSGLTGTCKFICTYNDWKSTESWGETFQDEGASFSAESGVIGIKLNKTSKIVNGNTKTDGKFKGDIYAQHVRQLAVQALSKDGATVTIDAVCFGTTAEYKEAAGISDANHTLHITAETCTNNWDNQLVVNANMPFGGTYTFSGKVKASAPVDLEIWTNDGVSYPNTKTQYGNPGIKATAEWTDFSLQLAPGTASVEGKDVNFDIKQLAIPFGKFAGDIYLDDLKLTDANGNVINGADFEVDFGGWLVNGSAKSELKEDTSVPATIQGVKQKVMLNSGKAYNLNGQLVNRNFKGIVIQNGKKVIKK